MSDNLIHDSYCEFLKERGWISLNGASGPWLTPYENSGKVYTTRDAMAVEMPDIFGNAPSYAIDLATCPDGQPCEQEREWGHPCDRDESGNYECERKVNALPAVPPCDP